MQNQKTSPNEFSQSGFFEEKNMLASSVLRHEDSQVKDLNGFKDVSGISMVSMNELLVKFIDRAPTIGVNK